MYKYCHLIPKQDKGCHFIAGAIVTILVALAFGSPWGMVAGMSAGVLKELWDLYKDGHFDTEDMVYTFAGSIFTCLTLKAFKIPMALLMT